MKDHYNYSLVDFLLDDSFVSWVKKDCPDDGIWAEYLRQNPSKEEEVSLAKEMIRSLKIAPVRPLSAHEIQAIAGSVNERLSKEDDHRAPLTFKTRNKFWNSPWLKVAAVILLIAGLGFLTRTYRPETTFRLSEVRHRTRGIQNTEQVTSQTGLVRLPDGTSVILKTGSTLRYPARFHSGAREVHLSGEAYFEVKKDRSHPFLVYSNGMVTKVLGTSFSVKAWKNDKLFKVTVTTGRVSVFSAKDADETTLRSSSLGNKQEKGILLAPNQQVTFYRSELKLVKQELLRPSALSEEIAKTQFNFVETPFSEVIATLSKAYDVSIAYDEKTMAGCPLTASLTDQSFYEKLTLICKAVEATFETSDGKIMIKGKGCDHVKLTNYESN